MHIFYIFFFLLSEYWPPHSHPGPSGFHIRTGMSVLIMPVLSFYARIHCISCWMQNICLLLSDIFHVLPAYIQAWKGTDRIRYPVSLFRNAGLRLSPSGSDPPHILRHSLLQGCGIVTVPCSQSLISASIPPGSYGGVLFLPAASLAVSETCPADRYSHLPYSLYMISANFLLEWKSKFYILTYLDFMRD